jgi:hypothetical protein
MVCVYSIYIYTPGRIIISFFPIFSSIEFALSNNVKYIHIVMMNNFVLDRKPFSSGFLFSVTLAIIYGKAQANSDSDKEAIS